MIAIASTGSTTTILDSNLSNGTKRKTKLQKNAVTKKKSSQLTRDFTPCTLSNVYKTKSVIQNGSYEEINTKMFLKNHVH
mmetsp:Transcript_9455/g.23220  ORF Transcript_9455/g.23220 Transcript_9455/m.23220 type:complete len:80 (+) Transcript_9455:1576-1815(+)